MANFKDKNGKEIQIDDVLQDDNTYWRLGFNEPTSEWYLLSCQGYEHDMSKTENMSYVGIYDDCQHLFICD